MSEWEGPPLPSLTTHLCRQGQQSGIVGPFGDVDGAPAGPDRGHETRPDQHRIETGPRHIQTSAFRSEMPGKFGGMQHHRTAFAHPFRKRESQSQVPDAIDHSIRNLDPGGPVERDARFTAQAQETKIAPGQ